MNRTSEVFHCGRTAEKRTVYGALLFCFCACINTGTFAADQSAWYPDVANSLGSEGSGQFGPANPSPGPVATRPTDAGRLLTENERKLAMKVFAGGLDYSKVRIYRHKWFFLQPDNMIMSTDGNIYYPPANIFYADDFTVSKSDRLERKTTLFIHEMGHVYQHQQGIDVVSRRLKEGGVYAYSIEAGRDLNDYTLEQQAEMIKNYLFCLQQCEAAGLKCDDIEHWAREQQCYYPALVNFKKDPNYLREAEKKRLLSLPAR